MVAIRRGWDNVVRSFVGFGDPLLYVCERLSSEVVLVPVRCRKEVGNNAILTQSLYGVCKNKNMTPTRIERMTLRNRKAGISRSTTELWGPRVCQAQAHLEQRALLLPFLLVFRSRQL